MRLTQATISAMILFVLGCSSNQNEITPTDNGITNKNWKLINDSYTFYLSNYDGELYEKDSLCADYVSLGEWEVVEDEIRYSYYDQSILYTQSFGEIVNYSDSQLNILLFNDSILDLQAELVYVAADTSISGCTDNLASNFNLLANCEDGSCNYNFDNLSPTFCSVDGDVAVMDELEAMAGGTLTLNQTVCDNASLGTANWDIHSVEGHAHEGEEEEGFVLFSGSWDYDFSDGLTGTSDVSSVSTDIPNDVRGVWDIVISLVDAEGNIAPEVVTPLHIENDFIPEYQLTTVTGLDLAVGGEPVWSPSSTITIEGTLSDSDGIQHWGYHLENESTEVEIAEDEGDAAGNTEVSFFWSIEIPTDAWPGEYHFYMHAEDIHGNSMETGFNVEIE